MTDDAHPALDSIAERLGDRLTFPGDPRWNAVRSPWNLAIDQHPVAVAAPGDLDDLRALLAAARADGLQLAVQPSGHGASGTLDGTVLVRTAAFDRLEVDVEGPVARIGAGVRMGGVLEALAGTGLVAMSGTSGVVNATALTLAGGHSWFARSLGFASSSLRAVELLTADGRHRWLRDADDPELLWALRGAGGAFGVVTAIEIDLHPAPVLTGGRILFESTDAAPVFRATRREHLALMVAMAGLVPLLWWLLGLLKGSAPLVDSLVTSLSLAAQWLLNRRVLENWVWWIIVDLISIPLYASRGLPLIAALYVVFLALCVQGWVRWRALVAAEPVRAAA